MGTCSAGNVKFIKSLGAKEVLDYRSTDVRIWAGEVGKKANLAVDCMGGKTLEDARWIVKDGGILVIVFQPPEQNRPEGCEAKYVKNVFFVMEPNGKQLSGVTRLMDGGNFCRCSIVYGRWKSWRMPY